ncbi:MAG: DUF4411 family protein [Pyrinomonadaceae bacterium]|nr:DUF4411 family protein [Pyrinomonadaceae bacterium]
MIYCIDTSSLIHGWNEKYPPEVFTSLWNDIENLINSGDLVSTEEVLTELTAGNDDLSVWASKQTNFFLPLDGKIQVEAANILADPINSKVIDTRKVGKNEADIWVIATAKVNNLTVITDEKYVQPIDVPNARKISIRNVCENINIPHLNFLEFIKDCKWKY